jgi:hypothetical protein
MPRTKRPTTKPTERTIAKTKPASVVNPEDATKELKARQDAFVGRYMNELYVFVRNQLLPFIADTAQARLLQESGWVQRMADAFRDDQPKNNGEWDLRAVVRACRFRHEWNRLQEFITANNLGPDDLICGINGFYTEILRDFVDRDWEARQKINYRLYTKSLLKERTKIPTDEIAAVLKIEE